MTISGLASSKELHPESCYSIDFILQANNIPLTIEERIMKRAYFKLKTEKEVIADGEFDMGTIRNIGVNSTSPDDLNDVMNIDMKPSESYESLISVSSTNAKMDAKRLEHINNETDDGKEEDLKNNIKEDLKVEGKIKLSQLFGSESLTSESQLNDKQPNSNDDSCYNYFLDPHTILKACLRTPAQPVSNVNAESAQNENFDQDFENQRILDNLKVCLSMMTSLSDTAKSEWNLWLGGSETAPQNTVNISGIKYNNDSMKLTDISMLTGKNTNEETLTRPAGRSRNSKKDDDYFDFLSPQDESNLSYEFSTRKRRSCNKKTSSFTNSKPLDDSPNTEVNDEVEDDGDSEYEGNSNDFGDEDICQLCKKPWLDSKDVAKLSQVFSYTELSGKIKVSKVRSIPKKTSESTVHSNVNNDYLQSIIQQSPPMAFYDGCRPPLPLIDSSVYNSTYAASIYNGDIAASRFLKSMPYDYQGPSRSNSNIEHNISPTVPNSGFLTVPIQTLHPVAIRNIGLVNGHTVASNSDAKGYFNSSSAHHSISNGYSQYINSNDSNDNRKYEVPTGRSHNLLDNLSKVKDTMIICEGCDGSFHMLCIGKTDLFHLFLLKYLTFICDRFILYTG